MFLIRMWRLKVLMDKVSMHIMMVVLTAVVIAFANSSVKFAASALSD